MLGSCVIEARWAGSPCEARRCALATPTAPASGLGRRVMRRCGMPWYASSQSAHAAPQPSRTLYGTRGAGRVLAPSGLPYNRCGCAVASPETVARTAIAYEPVRCLCRPAVPRGCHCPRLPSSAAAGRPWAQRRKPPHGAAVVGGVGFTPSWLGPSARPSGEQLASPQPRTGRAIAYNAGAVL